MLFALDLKRIAEQQAVPVDLEPYVKKLNSSRRRVMLVNNILQNVQVYHHFLQKVQVYQHFNQVYLIECTEVCSTGARERSPKCSIHVPATQNLASAYKHSLWLLDMPQVYQHFISVLIICIQQTFEMFIIEWDDMMDYSSHLKKILKNIL